MGERGFVVAIVGAAGELGTDLREVLVERGFPVSVWRLFDEEEAILALDEDIDGGGITSCGEIDLSGSDFVFLCGGPEQTNRILPEVARSSAIAIDLGQTLALRDDVTLIVPEVNADAVDLAVDERMLATPLPAATALAVAVAPIERAVRLRRLTVTCLEPVSTTDGGVQELARQTGDLLGGREPEPVLWPVRIAFNLIPQVGDIGGTGATEREWQVQRQLRRVLDLPDLPISVHVVRVPTFYGQGMVVAVETDDALDTESAQELFRGAPGMYLHEGARQSDNYPTLSDAVGSEATHVGRVREDPTVPCGVTFWLAIDGLRKGSTVNAVQIAECAARKLRKRG
jgi:aspartate-semialdehyde dehydrogenase